MSERLTVLLLPLQGRLDDITGRLLLVHYRGRSAASLAEAERVLRSERPPIRVAIIPSEPGEPDLARTLQALRAASLEKQLRFIAIGPRPDEPTRQKLGFAGVDRALYGAFTDTELRFLLNEATHDGSRPERREDPRVPTSLVAKVKTPTGVKVALVYNLSVRGAYLETMRPSQVGLRIGIELPLPGHTVDLTAQVVATNVTGNLRKENLPRGMAVRFESAPPDAASALLRFVEERIDHFRP